MYWRSTRRTNRRSAIMMKIMFYKPEYATYDVDSEFLYSFDYTKIDVTDPWVIRILKEIDNVEALAPKRI